MNPALQDTSRYYPTLSRRLTAGKFGATLWRVNSDEALAKLQRLSPERAGKVFALIEDLAELEALENAEDLRDAREALAELEAAPSKKGKEVAEPATIPYEQLRRELGLDS
jgi:hypothetical protein